eukprot:scaffold15310_cov20-Tisochrysis_lutea.AAC.3
MSHEPRQESGMRSSASVWWQCKQSQLPRECFCMGCQPQALKQEAPHPLCASCVEPAFLPPWAPHHQKTSSKSTHVQRVPTCSTTHLSFFRLIPPAPTPAHPFWRWPSVPPPASAAPGTRVGSAVAPAALGPAAGSAALSSHGGGDGGGSGTRGEAARGRRIVRGENLKADM